jgi:hypothetical protein
MHRTALLVVIAIGLTACGDSTTDDVVALVQVDGAHDVVVAREDDVDLTPTLLVCLVPHGDTGATDDNRCVDVDPWSWTRRSVAASLDPGPNSTLIVVIHEQAGFDIVAPTSLQTSDSVTVHLPAGPIGLLTPLTLNVIVAESDLTIDNAIGCLDTGLAGGINPVFIAAAEAASEPDDLQSACT